MNKLPLISICIPTYNRTSFLKRTLISITSTHTFHETDKVEIVISDNCSSDRTQEICSMFTEKYGEKIKYIRNKENIFHKNFGKALLSGSGEFRKLCNDTFVFSKNGIEKLVSVIESHILSKDILFFKNQYDNNSYSVIEKNASDMNEFIALATYFTTWSGGFGIWKEHISGVSNFFEDANFHFHQVELVLQLIKKYGHGVVVFDKLGETQPTVRYGYNVAEVFGKEYLGILSTYHHEGLINTKTFNDEKKNILCGHINPWYFDIKKRNNFIKNGYIKYLKNFYSKHIFFYTQLLRVFRKKIEYELKLYIQKHFISRNDFIEKEWRKENRHNTTHLHGLEIKNISRIHVGNHSSGVINASFSENIWETLEIGNFVSIAPGVRFLCEVSSSAGSPASTIQPAQNLPGMRFCSPIIVEDGVKIEANATILSGATLGQGCRVEADTVVSGDVEPYAIVKGNPAHVVGYLFPKEVRDRLRFVNLANLAPDAPQVQKMLSGEITPQNVDTVMEAFMG